MISSNTIGAIKIRIGFRGPLYYVYYNKDHQKIVFAMMSAPIFVHHSPHTVVVSILFY